MNPTRGRGNGGSSFLLLLLFALIAATADIAAAQPTGHGPGYFDPQNFNPSMAVIIVVLVTAFFFLVFFSIYIRRCAGGPFGGSGEDLGAGARPGGITFLTLGAAAARSRRLRGLDPAALEAFPTMAYADVKEHKVGKGELECAVCLSEFDDDDTLRLLPKCSHAFHADCIDAWLASHVTCPVCRANLVPGAADAPAASGAAAAATATPEQDDVLAATSAPQETPTAPPEQVTVVITDAAAEETEEERIRREEAAELVRIGGVKRALRSKSGRNPAQFPRSHTTGHSPAVPAAPPAAESAERYTLRLPEHVLREVVAAGKLRRTRSLQAFREGGSRSTRRGSRSVRLGQSGRLPNMSFFLTRSFSAWGSSLRRAEADAPGNGAKVAGAGDVTAAAEEQCDGGACPLPLGRRV